MEIKPKDDEYRRLYEMIEFLEREDLNPFEEEFVPSVKQQLLKHGKLSSRQVDVLEDIYARRK